MMRPHRLDRRLAKALDPVRSSIDDLTESLDAVRYGTVSEVAARVADAEQRVTAATAQSDARARQAERRHADAMAAIRAELGESLQTVAEWRRTAERIEYERDAARHNADSARSAEQAWKESWWQLKADHDAVLAQRDAMADLLARAVPKVAAKTTRARYTAELAALTPSPCEEPEPSDST